MKKNLRLVSLFLCAVLLLPLSVSASNIYNLLDSDFFQKKQGHSEYFASNFTAEEQNYIKNNGELRVAYHNSWAPIEFHDKKTGTASGISPDLLRELAGYCGLELSFVQAESYTQAIDMVKSGEVDAIAGFVSTRSMIQEYRLKFTLPYMDATAVFVGKDSGVLSDDFNGTVGIPEDYLGTKYYLMDRYPGLHSVVYKTVDDSLNALLSGAVDFVALNSYSADEALKDPLYNPLTLVSINDSVLPICIGLSPGSSPLLQSILNKSIRLLTPAIINEATFHYTVGVAYDRSFRERIFENLPGIIFFMVLLGVVLMGSIAWSKNTKTKALNKIAFFDPLTRRMNLYKFKTDLEELLEKPTDKQYAILSVDIDKFKSINDMFGYEYGDLLIIHLSDSISQLLSDGEFFARDNADKFIALIKYDPNSLPDWFLRLATLSDQVNSYKDIRLKLILSGGIYLIHKGDSNIPAMIDRANMARKSIKNNHLSTYAIYDESMYQHINQVKEIENTMAYALKNREFVVYLQPKYDLPTGKMNGAEALVRWLHPQTGLIPPDNFIPLFEKNGFIIELDYYVFREVCRLIRQWEDEGKLLVPISVNVSRRHVENTLLATNLLEIASEYGVKANQLELELTESAFSEADIAMLLENMNQLHNAGFMLSMDDFGSGFSSLTQLKELPIDILKLDKTFWGTNQQLPRIKALISNIIHLSKDLGIKTVSEGVETREQAEMLVEVGCDVAQGFLFARPMPSADFELLLEVSPDSCLVPGASTDS